MIMKQVLKSTILTGVVIALGVFFSSTGCRKKKDTIANVYVLDGNNATVAGCTVRVYGFPTVSGKASVVDLTSTTDGGGLATFNFNDIYQLGQSGVAVLNITAQKDSISGQGIIKIEQEEVNEVTVFVN